MHNHRPQIVIAEDSEGDRFLIEEAIRECQLELAVKAIDNGEAMISFLNVLASSHEIPCPALIVLDLNLPRRSGEEVFLHLRNSTRCADTPVIVITSSDSPQDRVRATKLGASAYFRKPSDLERFMELGGLIREVLDRQSSTRS